MPKKNLATMSLFYWAFKENQILVYCITTDDQCCSTLPTRRSCNVITDSKDRLKVPPLGPAEAS